jgi:transcriptional regulator with XRE-family HTH domain
MKSSKPDDLDRKIGAALAFVRKRDCNQTQAAFAFRFGISRGALSNIEAGRTPLSAILGWKICRALDMSPSWLCTGGNSSRPNIFPAADPVKLEKVEGLILSSKNGLFRDVWPAVGWFLYEDGGEGWNKNDLTEAESVVINSDVKSPLPAFLERMNKASSATGKKSELAKFLGAPLASVSRWLSGEREPGGEITLKMLHWVEQQERQK